MKLTARRVSITLRRTRPFKSSSRAIAPSASPATWLEHPCADCLQAVVDALERIGRVLGIGVVELEQHVLRVFDQRRDAPRAQAQQAEHRQILAVQREQHAVEQDEGHPHIARRAVVVDQEVRADVQLAVRLFVKARRLFQVVVDRIVGNSHAEVLCDPALFFRRRRVEVDPDRLHMGERVGAFDLFLEQPAVGQREDIQHGNSSGAALARSSAGPGLKRERSKGLDTVSPRGRAFRPAWSGRSPRRGDVQVELRKTRCEIIASASRPPGGPAAARAVLASV
jgi:hypothetical protein